MRLAVVAIKSRVCWLKVCAVVIPVIAPTLEPIVYSALYFIVYAILHDRTPLKVSNNVALGLQIIGAVARVICFNVALAILTNAHEFGHKFRFLGKG